MDCRGECSPLVDMVNTTTLPFLDVLIGMLGHKPQVPSPVAPPMMGPPPSFVWNFPPFWNILLMLKLAPLSGNCPHPL